MTSRPTCNAVVPCQVRCDVVLHQAFHLVHGHARYLNTALRGGRGNLKPTLQSASARYVNSSVVSSKPRSQCMVDSTALLAAAGFNLDALGSQGVADPMNNGGRGACMLLFCAFRWLCGQPR